MVPLSEVSRKINSLKKMNLKKMELLQILNFIEPILNHVQTDGIIFRKNKNVPYIRAVRVPEHPRKISSINYPPPEQIINYGRLNDTKQHWFYSSLSTPSALYEINALAGELVAVGQWKAKEDLYCHVFGFDDELFKLADSERVPSSELPNRTRNRRSRLINEFLALEFAKKVKIEEEYNYKISIAVGLWMKKINSTSNKITMDGILYPSIAMKMNADNVAFCKESVDFKLYLESVKLLKIIDSSADEYNVEIVDQSKHIDSKNDEIIWHGGVPSWSLDKQGAYKFEVVKNENDQKSWVCTNEDGEEIRANLKVEKVKHQSRRKTKINT